MQPKEESRRYLLKVSRENSVKLTATTFSIALLLLASIVSTFTILSSMRAGPFSVVVDRLIPSRDCVRSAIFTWSVLSIRLTRCAQERWIGRRG